MSAVNPKSIARREKLRRGVEEIGMSLFLEVQPAKRQEYFNSQQTKSQNKQSSSPFTNPWPNAIQIKDFFYFNSVIDVSQLDMPVDLLLQDDIMDKDPLPDVQAFPDQVPMLMSSCLRSAVKKRMTALMMLQVTLIVFFTFNIFIINIRDRCTMFYGRYAIQKPHH